MNVLITGATGLLGKSLIETSAHEHNIVGIYLGKYSMADAGNVKYRSVDICRSYSIEKLFDHNRIDAAIHTAGAADVDFCESHHEAAYRSNVISTENMIKLCSRAKAKLVYISTNAVFSGERAPYKEDDAVGPINSYGAMKMECEKKVAAAFEDHLIIRPILMYGWNGGCERKNLVTHLLEALPAGSIFNAVTDVRENPLYAVQCAEAIWALLGKALRGTYHVAGRDRVSRYEYAVTIAEVFGLDKGLIRPVDSGFFPNIAPRPKDTSYVTSKLEKAIGFVPLELRNGLERMKNSIQQKRG